MNSDSVGKKIYDIAEEIFPICRSITGDGVRETLKIIRNHLCDRNLLHIIEIPSGTRAFDWNVPKEWKIREAYIRNEKGDTIIDMKHNNLHVMGYSVAVDKWVNLEELKEHIYTQPDQEDVIPYVTSYYKEGFGFCMAKTQKDSLPEGKYHMLIDSELFDGSMTLAEVIIPGETKEEIFFSTYICHPSMGNNECSGPSLLTELINFVYGIKNRHYTYRFVFVPETIGAITYLSSKNNLEEMKHNVVAGFNISCVGDNLDYSIIESRYADTLADRVLTRVLEERKDIAPYSRYTYLQRASDERQYGAPGVELPLVTFCRSKFHSYKEYHTSADNLDFISPDGFQGSYEVMTRAICLLEANNKYMTTVLCEPQLGKRGLYPTTSQKGTKGDAGLYQDILAYSDGKNDIIDLCERMNISSDKMINAIKILEEVKLIKVIDEKMEV